MARSLGVLLVASARRGSVRPGHFFTVEETPLRRMADPVPVVVVSEWVSFLGAEQGVLASECCLPPDVHRASSAVDRAGRRTSPRLRKSSAVRKVVFFSGMGRCAA